jgi:dolichol-phosphate mannosyltransferase
MKTSPALSVVIPCHDEALVLPQAITRVQGACIASGITDHEIILVDDGSKDNTWEIIIRQTVLSAKIRGIRLSRNFGHQAALTAGLQASSGQRVLILDADLQDPPELLPQMLATLEAGNDVAYGVRINRQGDKPLKRLTAWIYYRVLNLLSEVPLPLDTGDFRLMSRRAVNAFLSLPEHGRFVRGMVAWIGFPQAPVPYSREPRFAGRSKYGPRKMMLLALDGITSFSLRPLRVGLLLGGLMLLVSCALLFFTIITWLFGYTVRGWASLLVAIIGIGGVQTILIGIIGEYVGKIFVESKCRPLYLIRDVIQSESQPAVGEEREHH